MANQLYEEIRRRNERRWGTDRFKLARRLGRDLYAATADILAELIQNAEDAGATVLGVHSLNSGLLVWNDGRPFNQRDIEAISGLFVTSKDAAAIGYFGIGFKAVLSVTDMPCILSGPFCFRLEHGLDPYPLDDQDPDLPSLVWERYEKLDGRGAVFWLPWRDADSEERLLLYSDQEIIAELLLFLERLKRIELGKDIWIADRRRQAESTKVVLLRCPNGDEQTYWVWDWERIIPEHILETIAGELDDEEQKKRWLNGPRKINLGIGIRLNRQGKPRALEEGRLFVRLPTGQPIGLPFHLQGRMALNLDRKRIRQDAALSHWTLEALAISIRELPAKLKENGLLPAAWHVFPRKGDGEPPFDHVAQTLLEAVESGEFFHADDGHAYSRAQVRLAHRAELYEVLGPSELSEVVGDLNVRWVHAELRFGRAAEVLRSLGVEEVSRDHVLRWLDTKTDEDWWKEREEPWLRELYRYLQAVQPSGNRWERTQFFAKLQNLPLVRLMNGQHVRPNEAVLPPDDATLVPEDLQKEIDGLPICLRSLAQDFQSLLRDLGVRDFGIELLLDRLLHRHYAGNRFPSNELHLSHIQLLFRLRKEISAETLRRWGDTFYLLQDRRGQYVKPSEAYIPTELGGLAEVEQLFRLVGGRPIVSPIDTQDTGSTDEWRSFLESLGVARLPRASASQIRWDGRCPECFAEPERESFRQWCEERGIVLPPSGNVSTWGWVGLDWNIDGFGEVFTMLTRRPLTLSEATALWVVGKELYDVSVQPVGGVYGACVDLRLTQAAMKWYYRTEHSRKGTALWLLRLKQSAWLPDENGQPRRPGELFDPELKEVLGASEAVAFLHPDIPLRDARDWARMLGIRFTANIEDVCDSLEERLARGAEVEDVRPVYRWLQMQAEDGDAREKIRKRFAASPLILIPDRGQYRLGEICWEDPTGTLPELKPHWSDLYRLFREFLEVPDRPTAEAITQRLLNLLDQKADSATLASVAHEIEKQWPELPERERRRLAEARWPGDIEGRPAWNVPHRLCLRDDPRIAQFFEGRVSWWALDGLNYLADQLGVHRISKATPEVEYGQVLHMEEGLTQRLKSLWPAIGWMARAQTAELPVESPVIYRVDTLRVSFVWNGVLSRPDESRRAVLSSDKTRLFALDDADPWDIGDALEEGWHVPYLREFLKDLWNVTESGWQRYLSRWKQKLAIQDPLPLYPTDQVELLTVSGRTEVQPASLLDGEKYSDAAPIHKGHHARSSPEERGDMLTDSTRRGYYSFSQREGEPEPAKPGAHSRRLGSTRRGYPGPDAPDPARVAFEAVAEAVQWLESQGYDVTDVSGYGLGYDLEAHKAGEIRYVEVKGRRRMGPVVLTENEYRVAQNKGAQYWLFIYVKEQGRPRYVKDPAHCLEFSELKREVMRYVTMDWADVSEGPA
ncbi:MAG: hypothetical protein Kow0047_24570 [Anaerolineae bacterium]